MGGERSTPQELLSLQDGNLWKTKTSCHQNEKGFLLPGGKRGKESENPKTILKCEKVRGGGSAALVEDPPNVIYRKGWRRR